ncbi:MAG: ATP-dependent Clp protease adapter protein ClpS [Bacteroidia bacterium]|nr:ATP-dependent Clp protease adapter protein ClpS [Bacteroidia bacterium]
MNPFPETITETDIEEEILRSEKKLNELVIYNDDFNTFDYVIDTLIRVCGHDPLQAEQCTLMIHYNGKCSVKRGEFKKLRPLCENILERGLTAEII